MDGAKTIDEDKYYRKSIVDKESGTIDLLFALTTIHN